MVPFPSWMCVALRVAAGGTLLVTTLACGGLIESPAAGYQALCDAPETCPDCADGPPEAFTPRMAKHIDRQLYNPGVRDSWAFLSQMPHDARGDALRYQARELGGVSPCTLADAYDDSFGPTHTIMRAICDVPTTCDDFDPDYYDAIRECIRDVPHPTTLARQFYADDGGGPFDPELVRTIAGENGIEDCPVVDALKRAKAER